MYGQYRKAQNQALMCKHEKAVKFLCRNISLQILKISYKSGSVEKY